MAQANKTHKYGYPMMRAMVLEFPNDHNTESLDRQYMLGDSLLVAPIFNNHGEGEFYVPDSGGKWISLLDEKVYAGGKWYTENFDYMNLPLLVRPNTVLITGNQDDTTNYDYSIKPTIHLYNLENGEHKQTLTNEYGEAINTIVVTMSHNKVIVNSRILKDFEVDFHADEYQHTYKCKGKQVELSIKRI